MNYISGIDGASGGWVCVRAKLDNLKNTEFIFAKNLKELINDQVQLVLIDMPVGLNIITKKGGRDVDRFARNKLIKRKSSIFNAPSRMILEEKDYSEANKLSKQFGLGLSKQSWNLIPKIKELDLILRSKRKTKIYESHPELSFQEMKGAYLEFKKKDKEGVKERSKILIHNNFKASFIDEFVNKNIKEYKPDDFIDACALFWSAKRTINGLELNIPDQPSFDSEGIIMQMKI